MKRDQMARAASRGWLVAIGLCVVGFCLFTPTLAEEDVRVQGSSQEKRNGESPQPATSLPVPFARANRFAPQNSAQPEPASRQVREIEGVMRFSSNLRGTMFDSGNPEQEAAEKRAALAKVKQEVEAEETSTTQRVSDDGELPLGPALMPQQPDPLHSATLLLRACARQLDGLAADLEEAGKYPEADRLRARAKQMRNDARQFSQPQEMTFR